MTIPAEFIELLREASSIVAVVGEHVELRKSGAQLIGRCPFHQERTASFYVHPGKGVFKCHGCSAGGDVFAFIRLLNKSTFREAVEYLAAKAGLQLSGFSPTPELKAKVSAMKARRERELELERFINDRIEAVNQHYRTLGRAANHAEECLRAGESDPYVHDLAWAAIQRYLAFQNRIERDGLLDPEILRSEWEQQRAAA
jgi:DNA primase